ncbi:MAG: hypothetical protein AAGF59_08075 [Pseudomonadota bacterium]
MKALVIHHLRSGFKDLATARLEAAGLELDNRYPIDGDPLPGPEADHAVALVHGSIADVTKHDAPGIAEEMHWIENWWRSQRPYFGICHGLQLAAQLLGARVGPPEHGRAEFGYYPLISHDPEEVPDGLHVFQWHYYGADLPDGARRMASTDLYPNQIVDLGPNRVGLQCHAELSRETQNWLRQVDPDGPRRPGGQSAETEAAMATQHYAEMQTWMQGFVDRWIECAGRPGQ